MFNDGQTLPGAAWRHLFYSHWKQVLKEGVAETLRKASASMFQHCRVVSATHTYGNRVTILDILYGKRYLNNAGVEDKFLWLFMRKDKAGNPVWDLTSGGIRTADVRRAVSAIQAHEVGKYDPGVPILGRRNADDRPRTAKYFRRELARARETNFDYPDSNKVKTAKITSKAKVEYDPDEVAGGHKLAQAARSENVTLDPTQPVFSYTGRCVPEKIMIDKALTKENIEAVVKRGGQIVLNVSVQDSGESRGLARAYHSLAERLAQAKIEHPKEYSGQFIFKYNVTREEQIQLLAATDVQIQVSKRETEGAGLTESNGPACGCLQLAATYLEGITQWGSVVNWDKLTGNVLIPQHDTPKGYKQCMLDAVEAFKDGNTLNTLEAKTIPVSIPLDVIFKSAADLRLAEASFKKESTPPKPRICGEVKPYQVNINHERAGNCSVDREGNNFTISANVESLRNVELSVTIDLNAHAAYDHNITGVVPRDLVKVELVSDYGIVVPLNTEKPSTNNQLTCSAKIPEWLITPFNGHIRVTSGLWYETIPVQIIIKDAPEIEPEHVDEGVAAELSAAA